MVANPRRVPRHRPQNTEGTLKRVPSPSLIDDRVDQEKICVFDSLFTFLFTRKGRKDKVTAAFQSH